MKLIFGVVALALGACGTSTEYVASTTITSADNKVARETGVDRMANERCDRELACGNVGPGRTWTDVAACRAAAHEDAQKQAGACGSTDFYDLAVCMNAIRATQCARGGLAGPAQCDGAKICR